MLSLVSFFPLWRLWFRLRRAKGHTFFYFAFVCSIWCFVISSSSVFFWYPIFVSSFFSQFVPSVRPQRHMCRIFIQTGKLNISNIWECAFQFFWSWNFNNWDLYEYFLKTAQKRWPGHVAITRSKITPGQRSRPQPWRPFPSHRKDEPTETAANPIHFGLHSIINESKTDGRRFIGFSSLRFLSFPLQCLTSKSPPGKKPTEWTPNTFPHWSPPIPIANSLF